IRKEIESKNKEYELLQSKYEFLRLDNLTHDSMIDQDKIEVNHGGFGKWKEKIEVSKKMKSEIQQ
uniref:TSA1-like protein n=1 Tax=Cucumis melo TaxID=3656 RepID=A0A9I9D8N9_CUCME